MNRKSTVNTDEKDEKGRFTKGNSGRPKGSRGKATLAAETLLQDEASTITRAAIEAAKEGDPTALRLCLERIVPRATDAPVTLNLPEISSATDAADAAGAAIEAMAAGELDPSQAGRCIAAIEGFGRALERSELEQRVAALERANDIEKQS